VRSRIPARHRVFQGAVRAAIRISTLARNAGPATVLCFLLLTAGAAWLTWSASAHVWELKSWNRLFGGSAQPAAGGASGMIARPEDNSGGGTYTTIDISGAGTSAGTGTILGNIDATGDVAGVYLDSNAAAHSFLRMADGTVTPINAPTAGTAATQGTFALSIDPTGSYVAGMYADSNNVYHGFLFQTASDTLTSLDVSGAGTTGHRGTVVLGVNSAGTVVGAYITGSSTNGTTYYNGFVRTIDGTVTAINAPDAGTGNQEGTLAMGINASGEITGLFFATKQVPFGFVRNTAGTLTEFGVDCQGSGTTNCYATIPVSIDAAGDVTGTSRSALTAGSVSHGFLRTADGAITTFDPVGSVAGSGLITGTLPLGIDPGGNYIAGTYMDSNGLAHGFMRGTSSGTITSFDAPQAATTLTFLIAGTGGYSVNASGEIAGTYVDANSIFHGFVLTPAAAAPAATPTFSPAAGTYTSVQAVTVSDTTPGATIYYTTNGTTPTTGSTMYGGPITVSSSETLEAIASAPGYTQSAAATAAYTINLPAAATPAFSPAAGVYSTAQTVTISDATSGATIYYTTNGTTPTAGSSVYSAPLSVSSTETIEAIATASGHSPSAAASATYTIGAPFSIVPASGSSTTATIQPGGTAVYTLTIAPSGATTFPAAIAFSASGLPSGATATFNPSTIAAGAGTTNVLLSIQTSSSSAMLRRNNAPWAIALCLLLVPFAGLRRRKTAIWGASGTAGSLFLLLLLCGAVAGLGACGGGGGSGSGSPQTYTVTVTATSGQTQQTTTVQLTVK
jgi:hypothetical protein